MPRERVPMTTLGTDQSQFNEAPFQRLHNLAIREPGMVEPLPGRLAVAANVGPSNYDARRMWALKDQETAREVALLRSTGGPTFELAALDESSAYTPTIADASLIGTPCGLTEARQRVFYAGPRGVLVFEEDVTLSRMLGMLQPTYIEIVADTATGAQAVASDTRVAYRATSHRIGDDGHEITSAPSYAIYIEQNSGAALDYTVRVGWPDPAGASDQRFREGDRIRLWRTRAVAYGSSTNDTYHFVKEVEISSADVTARYVDILDSAPPDSIGEELYTNPGIQGALQANWQLGPCADAAVYNGHAFYAATRLPMFGNYFVPGTIGSLSTAAERLHGIGSRDVAPATVTMGSPTITAVTSFVGVAAGQQIGSVHFPAGTKVLSFDAGAGTITATANATSGGAGVPSLTVSDIIEINGTEFVLSTIDRLLREVWTENLALIITLSDVILGDGGSSHTGLTFRIDSIAPFGSATGDGGFDTFTSTNFQNYSPSGTYPATLSAQSDERPNRLMWSKLDQPEHVPAVNELVIGKGEIVRLLSTQDRLLAFCTDGTYAVTGIGPNWNVDRVDKDIVIANQAAADEMNGNAYVYAQDRGLLRLNRGGGVDGLSKGAVQRAMDAEVRSAMDDGAYEAHVVCDALHDEVGVFFQSPPGSV